MWNVQWHYFEISDFEESQLSEDASTIVKNNFDNAICKVLNGRDSHVWPEWSQMRLKIFYIDIDSDDEEIGNVNEAKRILMKNNFTMLSKAT